MTETITTVDIKRAISRELGLPDRGEFDLPSGATAKFQLDTGTTFPFYLALENDGIWMTRKDVKALRKLLKAMLISVDPSTDLQR